MLVDNNVFLGYTVLDGNKKSNLDAHIINAYSKLDVGNIFCTYGNIGPEFKEYEARSVSVEPVTFEKDYYNENILINDKVDQKGIDLTKKHSDTEFEGKYLITAVPGVNSDQEQPYASVSMPSRGVTLYSVLSGSIDNIEEVIEYGKYSPSSITSSNLLLSKLWSDLNTLSTEETKDKNMKFNETYSHKIFSKLDGDFSFVSQMLSSKPSFVVGAMGNSYVTFYYVRYKFVHLLIWSNSNDLIQKLFAQMYEVPGERMWTYYNHIGTLSNGFFTVVPIVLCARFHSWEIAYRRAGGVQFAAGATIRFIRGVISGKVDSPATFSY